MSASSFGQTGSYETAAALTALGHAPGAGAGVGADYTGTVFADNVDGSSDEGGEGEDDANNEDALEEADGSASDVEMEVVRGSSHSSRPYKRKKRKRFRKMSPRLEAASAALDSVRSEREGAQWQVEAARAEVAEAQRRLEEAETRLRSYDTRIAEAEDAVVDAELEEPSKWNDMYKKLIEWRALHGNCNVPSLRNQPNPEIKHLAQWVSHQRLHYNLPKEKGKSLKNKPWTIVALNRIGFCWKVKEERWENFYADLLRFKEENGHCNVTDPKLVTWLSQQRSYVARNLITPERKRRLDEAGIDWEPTKNVWMSRLEELKRYRDKHGCCHMSENRKDPDFPLAQWVRRQRVMYDKNTAGEKTALTPERIDLLKDAGLYLDTKEDKWRRRYRLLLEFKEEHGNLYLADRDKPRPMLKKWAQEQRKQFAAKEGGEASSLTEERERLLREAGFCLELNASCQWLNMLVALKTFYEKKGHFDVPESYKNEPKLSGWITSQRNEYRLFRDGKRNKEGKRSFNQGKIMVLDELGFDWRYND